jgi:hypothetical protein
MRGLIDGVRSGLIADAQSVRVEGNVPDSNEAPH